MTARAERGPQWDVGTQQYVVISCRDQQQILFTKIHTRFLVDEGSDLYYDATPLLEVQQQERGDSRSRRNSNAVRPHDPYPRGQQTPHRASSSNHNPSSYPYGGTPTPSRYPSQGGFNSVSPGQFYNGRDAGSPARMSMGHDGAGGMGRRVTRGMTDDIYHGI